MDIFPMYIFQNGHLPECTFGRMDISPNVHFPEWTLARMYIWPNVHFPECTFSRMDISPKKLWAEWTFPRCTFSTMDTCQNVHLVEWTFLPKPIFQNGHLPKCTIDISNYYARWRNKTLLFCKPGKYMFYLIVLRASGLKATSAGA